MLDLVKLRRLSSGRFPIGVKSHRNVDSRVSRLKCNVIIKQTYMQICIYSKSVSFFFSRNGGLNGGAKQVQKSDIGQLEDAFTPSAG